MVISINITRYIDTQFYTRVAPYLLAGVGRPARIQPRPRLRPGVTGPDIDLNFPDTHFGSGTGPRSCNVAMDRRLTEEQAPAGELAGCAALGTHEACQCPSGGPALLRVWTGRNTGSTCHECHSGKQESADGPRHCISCLHALTLVCTRTALRRPWLAARPPGTGKNRAKEKNAAKVQELFEMHNDYPAKVSALICCFQIVNTIFSFCRLLLKSRNKLS